jgi:hypothetical protein
LPYKVEFSEIFNVANCTHYNPNVFCCIKSIFNNLFLI